MDCPQCDNQLEPVQGSVGDDGFAIETVYYCNVCDAYLTYNHRARRRVVNYTGDKEIVVDG